MLANRMTDDSSETKDIPVDQSSEPHIVVGCPSCKTKFAVESSLIAAYEVPKFHCSRCDLVFQLTPANREKQLTQESSANSRRWVLADGGESKTANPFSQPRLQASALKPTDFTLGEATDRAQPESRPQFAPLEERAGLSLLGLRPSAGAALSSAFTRQEAVSQPVQPNSTTPAPAGSVGDQQTELDPFALFDAPGSRPQTTIPTPSKPVEQQSPQAPQTALPVATPPQSKQEPLERNKPTQRQEISTTEGSPATPKASVGRRIAQGLRRATARLSVRNQGLVYLSVPVVALFAFFCVVSYASTLMPRTMDWALRSTVPSLLTGKVAQLPPTSLLVQEVSIDFEKTQSKEVIPVVRGVIHNSGNLNIGEVLVEALGFDAQGELVVRAQAPLRSALTREKISDLPLATVKKFQASLSGRNSTIDSGEKVAFSVALLNEAVIAPQVAYFSARIFSVGGSR